METLKIGNSWLWTALVYIPALIVLALVLARRAAIVRFLGEVRAELAKCTWPWNPEQTGLRRYKELVDSTVVVVVVTVILAAYVTTFDFLITRLVGLLVKF
jgi:preprotein translocase subunit SecE